MDFEQFKSFTLSQKKRETNKLINNNYKFYGYEQFGNEIMNLIGWDGKLDSLTDAQKNAIRTQFQNRVIIIDEFQNIKSDTSNVELKKVPPILRAIIKYAENIRLVLMSATPMYDSAGEIIFILNLLLENDGKPPIKKNEILDANDRLVPGGEKRLLEVSKGYISYLSGENPITFPLKIEAAPSKVFKDIIYDIKGNLIPMQDRFRNIKLYPCEMSPYQYKQYQNKLNSNNENNNNLYEENNNLNNNQNNRKNINKKQKNKKNNNKNESSHAKNQPLFYLSNIVLPNKNFENTLARRSHAYQR